MGTARKHWFRVADSIGLEPMSNDELATLVRFMGQLNTRWARDGLTAEQACTVLLRPGDLMALTGSGSLARARRLVDGLRSYVSQLRVELIGRNTRITWPKWAEFQELRPPKPPANGPEMTPKAPSPQDAPARRPTQDAGRSVPEIHKNTTVSSPTGRRRIGDGGSLSLTKAPASPEPDLVNERVAEIRERLCDKSTDDRNLRAIVEHLPWPEIEAAIFEAWARFRDQQTPNPTAYFVGVMKRRARELDIDLGFSQSHGVSAARPKVDGPRKAWA